MKIKKDSLDSCNDILKMLKFRWADCFRDLRRCVAKVDN